jgi:hypothetical protein
MKTIGDFVKGLWKAFVSLFRRKEMEKADGLQQATLGLQPGGLKFKAKGD